MPRRTEREIRANLATLEIENRAVREQLDLVLSSRGRRVLLIAGHPLWALHTAMSWLLGRKTFAALREMWSDFRVHRISLSAIAPGPDGDGSHATRPAVQWSPELGISGEVREGLLCFGSSHFTFRTPVGPGARLRAHCAMLPRAWDADDEDSNSWRASGLGPEKSKPHRAVLSPSKRWSDRRWRKLIVGVPAAASGEAIVTLETRAPAGAVRASAPAAWGDLTVEWPRSISERRQLARGAMRRLKEWGVRGTIAYALGRRRVDDQAAAYRRWVIRHRLDDRGLETLRATVEALPYQPLISVITPAHNTEPGVLTACLESVRAQAYRNWQHCIADDGSTLMGTQERASPVFE